MAHEIETKVLDIDKEEVLKKLHGLGAEKVLETRFVVDWFEEKGMKEGDQEWFMRIRTTSDGVSTVTWKAKSEITGVSRRHKEIDFEIGEPEKLADLFEELGLVVHGHQEKDRISFVYKDWRFDIDDYPGIPPFVEVEGKSEEHVKEGIKLLELEEHKTWADGERNLIQNVYGVDWYTMKF